MKLKAFTLAEILITLGIIGIIAAITIPSLITKYQQKETIAKLKESYSMIIQAVRLSESENGDISSWDLSSGCSDNFENFIAPYLKVSSSKLPAGKISYLYPNGIGKERLLSVISQGGTSYTLINGAQLFVPQYIKNRIDILIDLNGYQNKPNQMGRDAFYIMIYPELGVQFNQHNDTEYNTGTFTSLKTREQLKNGPAENNYQCNKKGNGMWCGALIQRDGWTISKDYPW